MDIRASFAGARERVRFMQNLGVDASEIVSVHTRDVDRIVVRTFEGAVETVGGSDGVTLVALGGYGRRELCPNSDLDLMLVFAERPGEEAKQLVRGLTYPLWDSGRTVGDRTRTLRDVLRLSGHLDEVCALLDLRYLAGDSRLFAELEGLLARRLERDRASIARDLEASMAERHARHGHAGDLLEPNIRDSAGGLRDIHTLGWAARLLLGVGDIDALVRAGHLSERDARTVRRARSFFLRVRIELHLQGGRHADHLYLADQDLVASFLGYESDPSRPAGERLMQEFYRHAREVEAIVTSFWEGIGHNRRPRRRWRQTPSHVLSDGCVLTGGRIDVVGVTSVRLDPSGWLRVFRQSTRTGASVAPAALERLRSELDGVSVSWTPSAREVFVDVLRSGESGRRALEDMDRTGLLSALVPAWEAVRAYPQRDLYHRYSVDRHLVACVAELADSRSSDERDVREAWALASDDEPLLVAALLHDIGKGGEGDHAVVGAQVAAGVARAMGFDSKSVEDVAFLVREHLLLGDVATRRNLSESRTIDEVCRRVSSPRRLAMLYLLARADARATGPQAWSSHRASLVRELYARCRARLEGRASGASAFPLAAVASALGIDEAEVARLAAPVGRAWLERFDAAALARQLALVRTPLAPDEIRTAVHRSEDVDEFVVAALDRPGLLATVAGVLALRGIDVHDAEAYTRSDGVAVEVFRVMGAHGPVPKERWERVRREVVAVLEGTLDLDAELARKRAQVRRRRPGLRRPTSIDVIVDNDASEYATVVEIHAEDRVGLLHAAARALADTGCDIASVRAATYGIRAVDVFYVRDLEGRKITDPGHLEGIRSTVSGMLSRDVGPGELGA